MAHKSIFNWSGGKDSTLALHHVLQDKNFDIGTLLTSVNEAHKRVSMHGVREELLDAQAESLGLPLKKLRLPEQPSMSEYEQIMADMMKEVKAEGYTHSIFGDIYLEDLKNYREEKLASQGFKAHFPIWKRDTKELVREFIGLGYKTIVVCVKAEFLDESFVGRVIDEDFLNDLPDNVDPCGENGEFHTFCYEGPVFKKPIPFEIGEKVFREYKAPKDKDDTCSGSEPAKKSMGFWFCDLVPV